MYLRSKLYIQDDFTVINYHLKNCLHTYQIVPHYKTNSGTNFFLSRALILANKICKHLDILFLTRGCFKSKSMLLLKNIY